MSDERNDPEQAERDARRYARPPSASPHYVRCTWYSGPNRCTRADGHAGPHQYEKEKP